MRRAAGFGIVVACAVGCGSARFGSSDTGAPSLTLPAHFAEGTGDADGGLAAGSAAPRRGARESQPAHAPAGEPPGGSVGSAQRQPTPAGAPDPVALSTASQWELTFHYSKGGVRVERVRSIQLERPLTTARRFGRFAVELWIGRELVERVRFDFPLLGGEPASSGARHPLHESARFAPGADTTQRVLVPASERATFALLVDRATGQSWPLSWPPAVAGAADGGAPSP